MTDDVLEPIVDTAPADTGVVEQQTDDAAVVDETADLGAVFDRLTTQNGADRGDDGKFKSADGDQEADKTAAQIDPNASQAVAAPAHLPQAIKADWDKLPETTRAAIALHQSEMDRKFGQIGEQYAQIKPIADQITAAAKDLPQLKAMPADQVVKEALQLAMIQQQLQANPLQTIMQVAQRYNVVDQLRAAFGGEPGGQDGAQVLHLQNTISEMQRKLDELGNPERVQQIFQQQMEQRETNTLVESLSKDKPFYKDVEARLPQFIKLAWEEKGEGADRKEVFDLAYEMATNAIPSVREKVRAAEAKATAAQQDPKRTEAAKKAASINVRSSMNGKEREPSELEALGSAYDRIMAMN